MNICIPYLISSNLQRKIFLKAHFRTKMLVNNDPFPAPKKKVCMVCSWFGRLLVITNNKKKADIHCEASCVAKRGLKSSECVFLKKGYLRRRAFQTLHKVFHTI